MNRYIFHRSRKYADEKNEQHSGNLEMDFDSLKKEGDEDDVV